jgi:hypothetical protein
MPAASRKQQRYLFWRFGPTWTKAHHFDVLADARRARKKGRK